MRQARPAIGQIVPRSIVDHAQQILHSHPRTHPRKGHLAGAHHRAARRQLAVPGVGIARRGLVPPFDDDAALGCIDPGVSVVLAVRLEVDRALALQLIGENPAAMLTDQLAYARDAPRLVGTPVQPVRQQWLPLHRVGVASKIQRRLAVLMAPVQPVDLARPARAIAGQQPRAVRPEHAVADFIVDHQFQRAHAPGRAIAILADLIQLDTVDVIGKQDAPGEQLVQLDRDLQ
ncbi:hypothetical protein D3C80_1472970 [compost metagenome]